MMQTSPAIEIADLRVSFPDRRAPGGRIVALDGITLSVPSGAIFGFLGPNGAGKSTTIQALLGFVAPTGGCVRLLGRDIRSAEARRRIGYLPEPPAAYPFLTAREWVETCARLSGLPRREAHSRADLLLGQFDLGGAADRRIGGFSRGMLQRLGLAQALVHDPDLLILDEPTSGMDPIGRHDIRRRRAVRRARGKRVFFSSHELSEVELICDRVAILNRGRVAFEGAPAERLRAGESLEQLFLRTVCPGPEGGTP